MSKVTTKEDDSKEEKEGWMSEDKELGSPTSSLQRKELASFNNPEDDEDEKAASLVSGGEENVCVCVRVRPFSTRELDLEGINGGSGGGEGLQSVVEMPDGLAGRVVYNERNPETGMYEEEKEVFQYTRSFWSIDESQLASPYSCVSQEDVYDAVGKPILRYAFAGFNNTVFAYGQTGSGKTYTMMGDFSSLSSAAAAGAHHKKTSGGSRRSSSATPTEFSSGTGMIPRLCRDLFEWIEVKKRRHEEQQRSKQENAHGLGGTHTKELVVTLTAIEIYNEQVKDLFWRNTPGRSKNQILKVRMHPTEGAFVDKVTKLQPSSWEECLRLIETGVAERTVAATAMNEESSRSHCVFEVTLTQTETISVTPVSEEDAAEHPEMVFNKKPSVFMKASKINLVDLAGSERLKKSGAEGIHMKEAAQINQSLLTLKRVIDALVTKSQAKTHAESASVIIPFRESTLTLLLSGSLGGNSKTTMVACVSPHYDNQEETLLTLRYANRTGKIVNTTKVNEDTVAKHALELRKQLLELQRKLAEGPKDEDAEALLDEIEIGREELKKMEQESAEAQRNAANMKKLAQQERGARFASAFYNSLQMVMLKVEKVKTAGRLKDARQQLQENQKEVQRLVKAIGKLDRQEEQHTEEMTKLEKEHGASREKDRRLEGRGHILQEECLELQEKLDKEIEKLYAQKIFNWIRLKRVQRTEDAKTLQVQQRVNREVEEEIMRAAEEYEKEVRCYADCEAVIKHRTVEAKTEMKKYVALREETEKNIEYIEAEIAMVKDAHQQEVEQIDQQWNTSYTDMRRGYFDKMEAVEKEFFVAEKRSLEGTTIVAESSVQEHLDEVAELEAELDSRKKYWANKMQGVLDEEKAKTHQGEVAIRRRLDLQVKEAEEEWRRKIEDLVQEHNKLEALKNAMDECAEELERKVIRPNEVVWNEMCFKPPADASENYKQFRKSILQDADPFRHLLLPSSSPPCHAKADDDHVDPVPQQQDGYGGGGGGSGKAPVLRFNFSRGPLSAGQAATSPAGGSHVKQTTTHRSVKPLFTASAR